MKTDDLSETVLVQRARQDLEAFGELVERLRELIQRQCHQRVGNWHDAEDLAQEAFVRAYRKLDQLTDPTRFVPWLRKIAANLCRDFLRSPARCEIADALPDTPGHAPDLDDLPLGELPEETRQCVLLFYEAGCSYAEIARALGISVPAVKARLSRARAILRKEMSTMDERERSPFTRRVLDKLEQLHSREPKARAQAVRALHQSLSTDQYATLLGYLRGAPFPPKWMPPGTPPEQVQWTDWEIVSNLRGAIRAARRYRTPEMRDALIALLRHRDHTVRLAAVGGLVSQQDPSVIPVLRQVMEEPDNPREVVAAAKSAIRQLERLPHPPAPDLEPRRLRDEVTQAAGDAQARVALRQRLEAALQDPSAKVRSHAAKALGELGDKRAVPALLALLDDPVPGVRQSAVVALGTLRSARAVPELMRYIGASPEIRHDLPALYALRDIGDPRALPAVLHVMERGPCYLPGILAREGVITRLVTRDTLPLLRETMARMADAYRARPRCTDGTANASEWEIVRVQLQRIYSAALARVAEAGDVPDLLRAFDQDPHSDALAKALARFADPSLLEPMRRHLLAGHAGAAEVLVRLGAAGLAVFKEALRSPEAPVRIAASFYLFNGEGSSALRASADAELLRLLDELAQHDPHSSVRLNARAAARRIRRPATWQHLDTA